MYIYIFIYICIYIIIYLSGFSYKKKTQGAPSNAVLDHQAGNWTVGRKREKLFVSAVGCIWLWTCSFLQLPKILQLICSFITVFRVYFTHTVQGS